MLSKQLCCFNENPELSMFAMKAYFTGVENMVFEWWIHHSKMGPQYMKNAKLLSPKKGWRLVGTAYQQKNYAPGAFHPFCLRGRRDNPYPECIQQGNLMNVGVGVMDKYARLHGGLMYLLFNFHSSTRRFAKDILNASCKAAPLYVLPGIIYVEAIKQLPQHLTRIRYFQDFSGFSVYADTKTQYITPGERKLVVL